MSASSSSRVNASFDWHSWTIVSAATGWPVLEHHVGEVGRRAPGAEYGLSLSTIC